MKKLFFLTALLCASVMAFAAIDWNNYEWLGDGAGGGAYSNKYKIALASGQAVVNIQKPDFADEAGIYTTFPAGIISCTLADDQYAVQGAGAVLYLSAFTLQETEVTVVHGTGTCVFTVYYVDGEASSVKDDPNLSLNKIAVTLSAGAPAETFQIEATKAAGSGSLSYESSDDDIASVSNTGLVTAVGRGTATITVRVAANDDFAAASKELTVTVTAPIDWESINWLEGSNNKYKMFVYPSGPTIVNVQSRNDKKSIYVTFSSAEFGECSLDASDYDTNGAGKFYYVSAFKKQITDFTQVQGGNTYTFSVYYEDGEPEDLTGFNIAKGKVVTAGHSSTPAYEANDGTLNTRWGSEGAVHYATAGEAAEDWWYVDLGDYYEIDSIRILYETACPTDYDLMISNNAAAWTVIGTYTEQPKTGNTIDKYNVYSFTDKVARYVKIFARNGYNDLQYGISIWEFEVYGKHGSIDDVNPPVMGSAVLSSEPEWNNVKIAVSATDVEDGVVTGFHVVDTNNGINQSLEAEEGIITVTGLSGETAYRFSVSAVDVAGNESSNAIVVNATTPIDASVPWVAAPIPSGSGKEVRPIYCDAFDSILAHSFDKSGFTGSPLLMEKEISGDHCLIYDMASYQVFTWGMYDDGNRAIIAKDGYYYGSYKGIDASEMEFLHIDIWSKEAVSNKFVIYINDQNLKTMRLSHDGKGWNSYNISLSEFIVAEDEIKRTCNVRWMKFDGFDTTSGKIAIDNVYFWKDNGSGTAISNTEAEVKAVKMIENGQLVIIKNGVKYNVAGQQVK